MFDRLFKRKKLSKPVDVSGLVTDMHSHLVPGIDDGSPDMKTSVELIREMRALGYQKIITTPHIMIDFYKNTPQIIQGGLERVREQLQRKKIDMEIVGAAEYLIDDGFKILLKENRVMTFSNKHVLVELSYFGVPPYLYDLSFDMQIKGYKIILAHPERYLFWHNNMQKYQELKDRGFLFQLNITSLTGHYSEEVRKMAQKLIDANMIDLVGSDLHNFHYLNLLKKSLYEPYLDKLLQSGNIKNHLL